MMVSLEAIWTMRSSMRIATLATIAGLLLSTPSHAQTFSSCNPTKQSGCPADPALGRSVSIDFTSGASNEFTTQGSITYNSNGAAFTVAHSGDSPTISSKWYIMFGKYSVTMRAAPGAGIVSSAVLQSDDLDEIDWEWLGAEKGQVQSNYFGKGQTTTYDRAAVHAVADTQAQFHTYTVEWTENQIIWQIDGSTVRVLNAGEANGQYPQTPMQLKLGAWSGGDSSNPQGTIQWAQGPTNYAAGPFTMYVKSLSVVDYSTGTSYAYGDTSGRWESIESNGGAVNANTGGSATVATAPAITSTSSGNDAWDGTHQTNTATATYTSLNGLPSGWTVTSSGKVVPPSAAPSTFQSTLSTPSPSSSPVASCSGSGYSVVTSYDQQGFLTTATVPAGIKTSWDDRGLPVTIYPSNCAASNPPTMIQKMLQITSASATPTASTGQSSLVPSADPASAITSTPANFGSGGSRSAATWMGGYYGACFALAIAGFLA